MLPKESVDEIEYVCMDNWKPQFLRYGDAFANKRSMLSCLNDFEHFRKESRFFYSEELWVRLGAHLRFCCRATQKSPSQRFHVLRALRLINRKLLTSSTMDIVDTAWIVTHLLREKAKRPKKTVLGSSSVQSTINERTFLYVTWRTMWLSS